MLSSISVMLSSISSVSVTVTLETHLTIDESCSNFSWPLHKIIVKSNKNDFFVDLFDRFSVPRPWLSSLLTTTPRVAKRLSSRWIWYVSRFNRVGNESMALEKGFLALSWCCLLYTFVGNSGVGRATKQLYKFARLLDFSKKNLATIANV